MIPVIYDAMADELRPVTQHDVDQMSKAKLALDGLIRDLANLTPDDDTKLWDQVDDAVVVARRIMENDLGTQAEPIEEWAAQEDARDPTMLEDRYGAPFKTIVLGGTTASAETSQPGVYVTAPPPDTFYADMLAPLPHSRKPRDGA